MRAGTSPQPVSPRGTTALTPWRATGAPDVSDAEGLKRVYGIDLGTTYSAIAYVDEHGKAVIVPNPESERITPSVVLFDGDTTTSSWATPPRSRPRWSPSGRLADQAAHGRPEFRLPVRGSGLQPGGHLVVHPPQARGRCPDRHRRRADHRRR